MNNQRSSIYGLSKAPSDFRVIAIISAYNEEDIIVPVIDHLTNEGIYSYLIDNWSTDQTFNLVNHIEQGIVGLERFPTAGPSQTYDWEDILKRKEELSWELDADWFMHYDADEIRESPWENVKLKDAIYMVDQLGYNAIDFELLNFHPVDNGYKPGSPLDRYFKFFLFNDFSGNKLQIKAWKKTSERVKLCESGGHSVEFADRKVFPFKFIMRHYPIRSQSQGERKIFDERIFRYNPIEREKGWHAQYNNVEKGDSFIKNPKYLLKFGSSFFNEFSLKQIIDLDQVNIQTNELLLKVADEKANAEQMVQKLEIELATEKTNAEQVIQNLEIQLADEKANAEQAVQNLEIQLTEERANAEQAIQNLQKSISRISSLEQKIDDLSREFAEKTEVYESEQKRLNEKNSQLDQEKVLVETQKAELQRAYDFAKKEIVDYYNSNSWKMTRPFRWISKKFRG